MSHSLRLRSTRSNPGVYGVRPLAGGEAGVHSDPTFLLPLLGEIGRSWDRWNDRRRVGAKRRQMTKGRKDEVEPSSRNQTQGNDGPRGKVGAEPSAPSTRPAPHLPGSPPLPRLRSTPGVGSRGRRSASRQGRTGPPLGWERRGGSRLRPAQGTGAVAKRTASLAGRVTGEPRTGSRVGEESGPERPRRRGFARRA